MLFKELVEQVEAFLRREAAEVFEEGAPLLLAVSYGVDSMVLLRVAEYLGKTRGLKFAVAHINHRLRSESDAEQEALVAYCQNRDIPISVRIWAHPDFGQASYEEAARHFRYANFGQILEQKGWSYLLTAHHLNDQAETVLMRLIQGSQLQALAGMRPVSALYSYSEAQVLRPFLDVPKADLYAIAQEEGLPYAEDASNQERAALRNRLRLDYLPALEELNPNVQDQLATFAKDLGAGWQLMEEALEAKTRGLMTGSKDHWQLAIDQLDHLPRNQRLLALQYAFQGSRVEALAAFPRQGLEKLLDFLLEGKAQGLWSLPGGYQLAKVYRQAYIYPAGQEKLSPSLSLTYSLKIGQSLTLEDGSQISLKVQNYGYGFLPRSASRDALQVRHRQAGDYLLLSQGQHKKIRRWFIDQKLPQADRDRAWLVALADQHILAIFLDGDFLYLERHENSPFHLFLEK
ncbi:tRNA lysidine(34) synthetase TilS [Aerococcus sanguinicola]|uniref:tRNA(Ile)-lysidine synthase n=1 Tax=Aerococcus sanguinicola TaxID=119206 RepID=A0A120I954_9LACT|nr:MULTISPECIES: tRNA lysidine(34) synthetase TilS [Aerococcus]AMB93851.1 hypothetical protein AWM72_03300 [Aerococcus sanguinicola]MDK7050293.1 tRNA lysidine(34) synthetase TilS [Aerococcus sanguinicola]OFT94939.1 hypothetical protein HMPREF3090_04840 [Aerococcus sp. HMSC23C02]PKZ21415.1 tRNA lysidine(34) synthetase TilS [Aerococcus sanguinicola]